MLVYVMVWLAVVFGINIASNTGKKIVIVQSTISIFIPALQALLKDKRNHWLWHSG